MSFQNHDVRFIAGERRRLVRRDQRPDQPRPVLLGNQAVFVRVIEIERPGRRQGRVIHVVVSLPVVQAVHHVIRRRFGRDVPAVRVQVREPPLESEIVGLARVREEVGQIDLQNVAAVHANRRGRVIPVVRHQVRHSAIHIDGRDPRFQVHLDRPIGVAQVPVLDRILKSRPRSAGRSPPSLPRASLRRSKKPGTSLQFARSCAGARLGAASRLRQINNPLRMDTRFNMTGTPIRYACVCGARKASVCLRPRVRRFSRRTVAPSSPRRAPRR